MFPIAVLLDRHKMIDGTERIGENGGNCLIVTDALIAMATLAIGILAIYNVIPEIPPAASYALIGVGGLIVLSWIPLGLYIVKNPELFFSDPEVMTSE